MSQKSNSPSRRDLLRPLELLGLSAAMSVFVGLIVLLTTREIILSLVALGISFIVVVVVLAMFVLSSKIDLNERRDLDEQNRSGH